MLFMMDFATQQFNAGLGSVTGNTTTLLNTIIACTTTYVLVSLFWAVVTYLALFRAILGLKWAYLAISGFGALQAMIGAVVVWFTPDFMSISEQMPMFAGMQECRLVIFFLALLLLAQQLWLILVLKDDIRLMSQPRKVVSPGGAHSA